jgi:hypothetical protein
MFVYLDYVTNGRLAVRERSVVAGFRCHVVRPERGDQQQLDADYAHHERSGVAG